MAFRAAQGGGPARPFAFSSDITALQQSIHVALGLSLLDVVLGDALVDEIVITRQRRKVLFGKSGPLGVNFAEKGLPGLGGYLRIYSGSVGGHSRHFKYL